MNIWRQESQVFHEVGWRASDFIDDRGGDLFKVVIKRIS